jgi:hypothetical protein
VTAVSSHEMRLVRVSVSVGALLLASSAQADTPSAIDMTEHVFGA